MIPTSGRAFVGGIDVVAHPTAAKQVIGVVPQTNTLDRSLTVWENLYFHGRFFGMANATAKRRGRRACSSSSGSPTGRRRRCAALSGGMAQRLMVARAIMHRPAILFLDEPTAGLDPQSRIALWEILGELHADGQTILLTTHYMEEADELCDRLAIIDHGHLLALGTPGRAQALDRRRHRGHRIGRPATSTGSPTCSRADSPGATRVDARRRDRAASRCARSTACCPRVVRRRRAQRVRRHRPLGHRADARDRLHQPHREGPARMTAVTIPAAHRPTLAPTLRADPARARHASRSARCSCATSSCCARRSRSSCPARSCSRSCWSSCSPTCSRRSARASAARARRERVLHRCSSPASSGSRSCSRASSRSRCRWCRSSGTRARSRTACSRRCRCRCVAIEKVVAGALNGAVRRAARVPDRGDRARDAGAPRHQLAGAAHARRRSPATCAARSGSRSAPGSTPGRCRCCSASSCCRSRSSAASTTRGRRSSRSGGCRSLVLVNPLVYMCEGFRAALTTGAAHEPLGRLPGA